MRSTETSLCFKRLEESTITEEIRLKAEEELCETEETRKKCLEELRILLKGEKDLIANTTDEFLLQFLRGKKFKTREAFETLKNFYSHRMRYPNFYDYSLEHNIVVLKSNLLNFLSLRAPDDSAIWAVRVGLWNPDDFDFETLLRFGLLCHEKALQNPVTQICGITSVVDLQGFSWSHLLHISPSMLRAFVQASQDCFPIRHKAIHIINNPIIFRILFSIMKPLIKKKIINRIHFHGYNLSSLHEHVPPCLLPEEFGGSLGSFANEAFSSSVLESEKEFLDDRKYGYVSRH